MICEKCNKPMRLDSEYDYEEAGIKGEGVVRNYVCSNCGSYAEFYFDETKKLSKIKESKGYGNCGFCGGALIWQSDFDFDDFGYEGEGIVSQAICSNCGAEVETRVRTDENNRENS